jgi:hypothetical protein
MAAEQTVRECVRRLQAHVLMCRGRWTDAMGELYGEELTAYPDRVSEQITDRLLRDESIPNANTIRRMAVDYLPSLKGPHIEFKRCTPAERHALLVDGFLHEKSASARQSYAERHPGEEIPEPWAGMFRRWAAKDVQNPSSTVVAEEDDPFAWPGEAAA